MANGNTRDIADNVTNDKTRYITKNVTKNNSNDKLVM